MAEDRRRYLRPKTDADKDRLQALGGEFDRERARARRQRRHWEAIKNEPDASGAAAAASEWSATIEQALGIAEVISRGPAHDFAGLAIKFEAAWWWIVEDDNLLDDRVRLWLVRFRRSLHRLSGQP
jgi:hypothetical protein